MSIQIQPPVPGQNSMALWEQAIKEARSRKESEICFSPGRYEFWEDGCTRRYCWFTNNDEGIKTIALDLQDWNGLTLRGHQTELFFHGRISPLVAERCADLTVSGITIDFEDSFVSDADVIRKDDDLCWIKVFGKHSFRNGKLVFSDDLYDNLPGNLIFYSYHQERHELVPENRIVRIPNCNLQEQNGLIGIRGLADLIKSSHLVIKHEARLCPGLVFHQCRNVQISCITLHHAAGMGILAQLCTNVALQNINITPRGRRASVSDDAVHFCECRGKLSLTACHLSGTLDDTLNVHGVYRPLKLRVPGGKFYYLDTGHYQQMGLPAAMPGDTLELVKNDTYIPYATLKLKDAVQLNKCITKIIPEGEIPDTWNRGDCARVLDVAEAELTVTACSFAPLCGRGALASGLKNVLIKNCRFHTPGAAIFVSGDCTYWYESGPVKQMTIENNEFDNCCFLQNVSTTETISVFPEIQKYTDGFFYHGTMAIRNNFFRSNRRPLIALSSVSSATVENNTIELDTTYPAIRPANPAYSFARADSPWVIWQYTGHVIVHNTSPAEN